MYVFAQTSTSVLYNKWIQIKLYFTLLYFTLLLSSVMELLYSSAIKYTLLQSGGIVYTAGDRAPALSFVVSSPDCFLSVLLDDTSLPILSWHSPFQR